MDDSSWGGRDTGSMVDEHDMRNGHEDKYLCLELSAGRSCIATVLIPKHFQAVSCGSHHMCLTSSIPGNSKGQ